MENNQIKAVVITVSDSRAEKDDISGVTLVGLLISIGAEVIEKIIVKDELEKISDALKTESERANLIITTGGTGFAPRDVTPEATRAVIEKEVPGLSEAMRFETSKKTPTAILSRGVCGIYHQTLIVNLPGSPKSVQECFDVLKPVLQHAINLVTGNTKH